MTQWSGRDRAHMQRALQLARRGLRTADPNPRVGCVVARGGEIVAEAFHKKAGGAHAEAAALTQAGRAAEGADVFVTLAPCRHHGRTPPCTAQLAAAGVARVVAACDDPNPAAGGGLAELRAAGVRVECGLLAAEARELNAGFFMRFEKKRPFVRLKSAASVDGVTAMAGGESKWITGAAARAAGRKLRARASAVVTGSGTVLADNPALRAPNQKRQPLRVVVDSGLRAPPDAEVFAPPGPAMVVTACADENLFAPFEKRGVRVRAVKAEAAGRVDLGALMAVLCEEECNEAHLECGATLAGAFFAAGLVDEWALYVAPKILGGGGAGLAGVRLPNLAAAFNFTFHGARRVGEDLQLTLRPAG